MLLLRYLSVEVTYAKTFAIWKFSIWQINNLPANNVFAAQVENMCFSQSNC